MPEVDRDLEEVIRFCRRFDQEYLKTLRGNAGKLEKIAASAQASLGGTQFANNAAQKLTEAAAKLKKAAAGGEQRILELEKRAKTQLAEKDRLEGMCR